MAETQTPATLADVYARYRQIAPLGTAPTARDLIRSLVLEGWRLWEQQAAGEDLDVKDTGRLGSSMAAAHCLAWLSRANPVLADKAALEVAAAWEDGGDVGDWLHRHGTDAGLDMAELSALARAETALRRPEWREGGAEGTGAGDESPEASWAASRAPGLREGLRMIRALGPLTRDQIAEGLNAGLPVAFSRACAPGGWVCAVPDEGAPGGICGYPVESEPCGVHVPLCGSCGANRVTAGPDGTPGRFCPDCLDQCRQDASPAHSCPVCSMGSGVVPS